MPTSIPACWAMPAPWPSPPRRCSPAPALTDRDPGAWPRRWATRWARDHADRPRWRGARRLRAGPAAMDNHSSRPEVQAALMGDPRRRRERPLQRHPQTRPPLPGRAHSMRRPSRPGRRHRAGRPAQCDARSGPRHALDQPARHGPGDQHPGYPPGDPLRPRHQPAADRATPGDVAHRHGRPGGARASRHPRRTGATGRRNQHDGRPPGRHGAPPHQ